MKFQTLIKWLVVSVSVVIFAFMSIIFLGAFINLGNEKNAGEFQYNYTKEQKTDEENQDDFDMEYKPKKDTESKIVVDEFGSFNNYVSNITKDFNGETELNDIYTSENKKYHLVVTSTIYLKYYKEKDEIPDNLQVLVDEGVNVTNEFENGDNPDAYYDELKKIHNQLEKTITKRN